MKKALAILMALAMVATAAFAEDAATYGNNATIAVSGNATLTWGIDLENDGNTGFKNGSEWEVKIPLLAKQSFTKGGEGSYAEIQIKDAESIMISKHDGKAFKADKSVDSVNAKLVFGKVYVTINGAPDFSPNNVELLKPIKNDDYFADNHEGKLLRFEPGFGTPNDAKNATTYDGYGTKIGYKDEKFDVGVKLASRWAYDNSAFYQDADEDGELDGEKHILPDHKSKYAIGFDATVKPMDMLEVAGTVNYATWKRATTAADDGEFANGILTVGAKVVAKPIDGLEVTAALDGTNDAILMDADGEVADTFAMEGSLSAKYKFVEAGLYYASASTPYTTTMLAQDPASEAKSVTGTFALGDTWMPSFDADGVNIGNIAAYVKLTDGDFVENLDGWFTFMMYNPMTAWDELENPEGDPLLVAPIAIGFGANYKYAMNDVNYVKPFVELYGQNNLAAYDEDDADLLGFGYVVDADGEIVAASFQTALSIGVEYGLFSNATVTAKYEAGSTIKDHAMKLLKSSMATDKGDFTVACKVTY